MLKHDRKLSEWLEFESFMEHLTAGWNFIHYTTHGNSR